MIQSSVLKADERLTDSEYQTCYYCSGDGGFFDESGEPIEQCEQCAGRGIIDMRG